ncbi:MAG: acyl-CoA thioesterase [Pseudomonadota bacterium]
MFSHQHQIYFGDCDPAGILFYPNHFRLMDATFQAWLASLNFSQAKFQNELGIIGTGVLDASASFRAPLRDGDLMNHQMTIESWSGKTVSLNYRGTVGETCVLEGKEVRGLFMSGESGLVLSSIDPFRNLIEAGTKIDHD